MRRYSACSSGRPPPDVRSLLGLGLLALVLAGLSLGIGGGGSDFASLPSLIAGKVDDDYLAMVLTELRLPRTLAGLLLGAGLGCSGVLLQTITRNPLAESGLLGVNSGAALAVAVSLVLFDDQALSLQVYWALGGAFAGSLLVLACARVNRGESSPLRLILAGLAIGATCQGLMAFLLLSDQAGLDQYRFWVLGSLARITPDHLRAGLPILALGLAAVTVLVRPLSAMTLGDDLARSLGFRPAWTRFGSVCAVALLAGCAVALAGPLAFLGLVAPHLARALGGVAVGRQLLYSALIGASLLLAADLLARSIARPFEAPVSALLALIGAPLLIWMVRSDALLGLARGGTDL